MLVCWEIPFIAKISQKTRESMFYTRKWTSGLTAGQLESLLGSLWEQITSRCLIIWGQLLEISQGLKPDSRKFFSVFGHETVKCVERSRSISPSRKFNFPDCRVHVSLLLWWLRYLWSSNFTSKSWQIYERSCYIAVTVRK